MIEQRQIRMIISYIRNEFPLKWAVAIEKFKEEIACENDDEFALTNITNKLLVDTDMLVDDTDDALALISALTNALYAEIVPTTKKFDYIEFNAEGNVTPYTRYELYGDKLL